MSLHKLTKNTNAREIAYPVIVLFLICLVITFALSLTNKITEPKIDALNTKTQEASRQKLLRADKYKEDTITFDGEEYTYYAAVKDNKTVGYLLTVNEKGYGGNLQVMVAVLPDHKVKAVEILDVTNETPGLGQNTAQKSFYSQFKGLTKDITVQKGSADKEKNEINAVTGATISSKAVTKAVNKAVEIIAGIKVGEQNEK